MGMPQTQQRKYSWHEMDARAAGVAGSCSMLQQVPEVYKRYPGLNIKVFDRLGYYDFTQPQPGLSNSVFNMNMGKVLQDMPELYPEHMFDSHDKRLKSYSAGKDYIYKTLDKGSAAHLGVNTRSFVNRQTQERIDALNSIVTDYSDMATRQEMLATLAGMDKKDMDGEIRGTLGELHTFVRAHEFQHGRSAQAWRNNPASYDVMQATNNEIESPEYAKFKFKTVQASGPNDPYVKYLDEQISDTVAALHHIRNGGDIGLIQNIADARAIGAVNTSTPIYFTSNALDNIIQNEDKARERLKNMSPEEVDKLGVWVVSNVSWDREEYYENAMISCYGRYQRMKEGGAPEEQLAAELKHANKRAFEAGKPFNEDPQVLNAMINQSKDKLDALQTRAKAGYQRLMVGRPELGTFTPQDHAIEVQAAVRFNQERHPEFAGPEGARHLVALRQRSLTAEGQLTPVDTTIHKVLDERYTQEAEQERTQLRPSPQMQVQNTHSMA